MQEPTWPTEASIREMPTKRASFLKKAQSLASPSGYLGLLRIPSSLGAIRQSSSNVPSNIMLESSHAKEESAL